MPATNTPTPDPAPDRMDQERRIAHTARNNPALLAQFHNITGNRYRPDNPSPATLRARVRRYNGNLAAHHLDIVDNQMTELMENQERTPLETYMAAHKAVTNAFIAAVAAYEANLDDERDSLAWHNAANALRIAASICEEAEKAAAREAADIGPEPAS